MVFGFLMCGNISSEKITETQSLLFCKSSNLTFVGFEISLPLPLLAADNSAKKEAIQETRLFLTESIQAFGGAYVKSMACNGRSGGNFTRKLCF